VVWQLEGEEVRGLVRLPEPERAAAAAARRDHEAGRVNGHAPGGALEVLLGPQELLALTGLPIEEHHYRLADAREGVGDVGDATAGEPLAVGAERDAAGAADVRAEGLVVLV